MSETSTTPSVPRYDPKVHKDPFTPGSLGTGIFFSTAFLLFAMIDLSAVIYASMNNKPHFLGDYLTFKSDAPIWKYYQLFELCMYPIFIFVIVKDFIGVFTKQANTTRNILDVANFIQLCCGMYIGIIKIAPIVSSIIDAKKSSQDSVNTLLPLFTMVFALNLFGWFLPILRYQNYLQDPMFNQQNQEIKKKRE